MKTTTSRRHRISRLLSLFLTLTLSLSLGACFSDTTMGPSRTPDDGDTDPSPAKPKLYEVRIDLSHIKVLGTCDGADNPGDFEYTIEIWGRDEGNHYVKHKELTGHFTGYAEQTHRIGHVETFLVEPGKNYYVGFKATDEDPAGNADDYVGYAQDVNTTGGQLEYHHLLKIGGSGCGLSLTYTAKEVPLY